ncbi:MAG TPA: DivIVA domain-containing protein [Acidimicrobiia bacterium]
MLTAADVEQKTFSTALRGYDLDEVDEFLDEIVATIRTLNEQLEEARAADWASAVGAPTPAPEPAAIVEPETAIEPEPKLETELEAEPMVEAPVRDIDESAIGRALIAAQTAADRLLDDARDEAGKIVEEAKSEADSWSAEREAKRREAEAEIARLTDRVASVRSELSVLAGEVAEKLDEMDSVLNEGTDTDVTSQGDGEEAEAVVEVGHEGEASPEGWGYTDGEFTPDRDADAPSNGVDHLDAMLTGVVNDLQLSSDDSESEEGGYEGNREEPDQDEDEADE